MKSNLKTFIFLSLIQFNPEYEISDIYYLIIVKMAINIVFFIYAIFAY